MKQTIMVMLFSLILVFSSFTQSKEVQVFLMAGQSNMAGAGNFDAIPQEDLAHLKKVANQITLVHKKQPLDEATPKLFVSSKYHVDKYGFSRSFGPEIPMLIALTKANPNTQYLVIKTAYGGTSLHGAWNPNWSIDKAKVSEKGKYKQGLKLFSEHINLIKDSLQQLKQQNINYKLVGLGWLQGESDTNSNTKADNYQSNLQNLIDAYRRELTQPNLPVVIAQVNPPSRKNAKGVDKVRQAQYQVAKLDPFTQLIPTSKDPNWQDFPKHFDNVHYNTQGQLRLGEAFAKAFSTH